MIQQTDADSASRFAGESASLPGSGPTVELLRTPAGNRLSYYFYPSSSAAADTAVVYVHGLEDHSGWFHPTARYLSGLGYRVIGMDRRGNGINQMEMGYQSGHINRYHYFLDDLSALVDAVRSRNRRVYLAGYSWGALLCLLYADSPASREGPGVDGIVLIAPPLTNEIEPKIWAKTGLYVFRWLMQKKRFRSPLEVSDYTRSPQLRAYIRSDALRVDRFTARFWTEADKLYDRVRNLSGPVTIPLLVNVPEKDRMADDKAYVPFLRDLAKTMDILRYPGANHALVLERDRQLAQDIAAWIEDRSVR